MNKAKQSPYLIEIQTKNGQWLIVGSSRSEASAHKVGKSTVKILNGQAYKITRRLG